MNITVISINAMLDRAQRGEYGASRRYISTTTEALARPVGSHAVRLLTCPNGRDSR